MVMAGQFSASVPTAHVLRRRALYTQPQEESTIYTLAGECECADVTLYKSMPCTSTLMRVKRPLTLSGYSHDVSGIIGGQTEIRRTNPTVVCKGGRIDWGVCASMARLPIADRSLGYELSTEWVNGENHADRDRRRLMGRSKSIRISEERSVRRQRIYSLLHSEHSANAAWAVDITDSGGSDFWTQRMAAPEAITV
ncbi:hypothetical protein DFP72DRAFT_855154 [Ephemerocybe angulata]|uniref:Uncharacterized protein n=1 Tax=Ephemerocybe angulata TaxID=980116 RepID=A0A8H6HHW3_9AGAR|nr:hypothetical protein DFP72DRAFT_855154 [Tulosesus angulatus]